MRTLSSFSCTVLPLSSKIWYCMAKLGKKNYLENETKQLLQIAVCKSSREGALCKGRSSTETTVWYWGSPRWEEKIYFRVVVVTTEINLPVSTLDLCCVVPVTSRTNSSGMCQDCCALPEHFAGTPQALSSCCEMAFLVALFPRRNSLWQETSDFWTL